VSHVCICHNFYTISNLCAAYKLLGISKPLAFRRMLRRSKITRKVAIRCGIDKYRLVWTTKYRYQVLGNDVGCGYRELLRKIAQSKEVTIYAGSINRDHMHMLIEIPSNLSISKAVQYLRGKSSHKLLSECSKLRKRYWGQHLRAKG